MLVAPPLSPGDRKGKPAEDSGGKPADDSGRKGAAEDSGGKGAAEDRVDMSLFPTDMVDDSGDSGNGGKATASGGKGGGKGDKGGKASDDDMPDSERYSNYPQCYYVNKQGFCKPVYPAPPPAPHNHNHLFTMEMLSHTPKNKPWQRLVCESCGGYMIDKVKCARRNSADSEIDY